MDKDNKHTPRRVVARESRLFIFTDILLLAFALLFSYLLTHDFSPSQETIDQFLHVLPFFLVIQIFFFSILGVYRSIWRYSGPSDLLLLLQGIFLNLAFCSLASIGLRTYLISPRLIQLFDGLVKGSTQFLFIGYAPSQLRVPFSVVVLNSILSFLLVGGTRMLGRLWVELKRREVTPAVKRLLVIGAGNPSEGALRELKRNPSLPFQPVGIISEIPNRIGLKIHGVKILGEIQDIPAILERVKADEILIALPSHSGKLIREILRLTEPFSVRIRTLPAMEDFLEGKIRINQFPEIKPEDLLGREQVDIDTSAIAAYLENKVVLVTGAGGSIGSELCRQISGFKPGCLVLLGGGENSIYEIEIELHHRFPELKLIPVICNIQDTLRLKQVFDKYHPEVVFHAAAHKHVPMMELNPGEAIKNNIWGTLNVAQAARDAGTQRFIFISTDKAISPANVMGASKRAAELVVESLAKNSKTLFAIVRFGNVLGSRGSAIPLFQRQILWGGPVTVTHPEATRFFMSIPEAVKLVIQTGSMAEKGGIYSLDMGEPVLISEIARNLISMAGLEPDTDIEIKYTGLRPGEKLVEESVTTGKGIQSTQYKGIYQLSPDVINTDAYLKAVEALREWLKEEHSASETLQKIQNLIDIGAPSPKSL
jgi:FlaA1/EpsC-like NDP-sugar epimerase